MKEKLKASVMSIGLMLLGLVMPATASAQMVVSDPSNLAQNMIQAARSAKELAKTKEILGENQALNRKAKRISKNTKKMIEGLSPGEMAQLRDYLNQIESVYDQGRGLSYAYGDTVEEFEQLYTDFEPATKGGEEYEQLQAKWERQTDHALKQAFVTHGYGGDNVKERMDRLDELVTASDDAEGLLKAIQLGNRIRAELVSQMAQLQQMIAADSRARLSYMAEHKAEQKNQRARQRDLFEGLGETRPREVKEYPKFDR
jgi:P-type conjugative transfer protein TrbJ